MSVESLFNLDKKMSLLPIERLVIESFLRELKPEHSIEIGSENGGTSDVIAKHSGNLTCFDVDPDVGDNLKKISNIQFRCGRSDETLPVYIRESENENRKVGFAFVDGDHSYEGVFQDLSLILSSSVFDDCVILAHDCMMDGVRRAFVDVVSKSSVDIVVSNVDFSQGVVGIQENQSKGRAGGLGLIVTGKKSELSIIEKNSQQCFYGEYVDKIDPVSNSMFTKIWRWVIPKKLRDKLWILRNGQNDLSK